MTNSFIEKQFPVSKVSKESFKERKANNGQTLTGLGKWWGRKPLVLVRAAILGCLLPATDNPKRDMEVFLKLMSMDEEGLQLRKSKQFSASELYAVIKKHQRLTAKYAHWFETDGGKIKLVKGAPRDEMEAAAFATLGYDAKLAMCVRPEQLENISKQAWREINNHLGTDASSLQELVNQLSQKRFGKNVTVGDCFCGGGSIPFEAARMGCDVYASDLNPIAGLLTWASLNICGAEENELNEIKEFQRNAYDTIDKKITELGIEHNEKGDRAISYLYCVEARCPECGMRVPMAPSWIIGKGTRTVAVLREDGDHFDITVKMGATTQEVKESEQGTVNGQNLVCPHCKKSTPVSVLRRDRTDADGKTVYSLRIWEQNEFESRPDDIFQERLYAIKYETTNGKRYYRAPNERDLDNEEKVRNIVAKHIVEWQEQGLIPSMVIDPSDRSQPHGSPTAHLRDSRGWGYWHQLFNARQLLTNHMFVDLQMPRNKNQVAASLLGLNKVIIFNSRLSMWVTASGVEKPVWIFTNQALNTFYNYGCSAVPSLENCWKIPVNWYPKMQKKSKVILSDARDVKHNASIWITDPPYADAVNYHELSEVSLAWDKDRLMGAFPEWYSDSKRILAIKGDNQFAQSMIDIYHNLANHMPNDGMQIVMFTHSDPAVWAQLALIMWKAGLKVTAAWNIATETDAAGLKNGNYVKGTVLLVLRKQVGDDEAFLDELNSDIKAEVKNQIESMQALDDKEDPNFADPDYVLAAYAASLKVLTSYKSIGEIDLDYELNLAIHEPARSKVVALIERAKKIAYDCIIPLGFDSYLWKDLSPSERFYIKGLESEKNGNYQISTYQEYARGFAISSYSQMMANEKANTARLKTPTEFAMRTINDVPDFERSTLRLVLAAIHVAIKEDETPEKGLWHIKNNLADYWGNRDMLRQLLAFLRDCDGIENMPHWQDCARMAEHIYVLVDNDHI